jgi:hypothetical protein
MRETCVRGDLSRHLSVRGDIAAIHRRGLTERAAQVRAHKG